MAVHYIYKYIYKGQDRVLVTIGANGEIIEQKVDEIKVCIRFQATD